LGGGMFKVDNQGNLSLGKRTVSDEETAAVFFVSKDGALSINDTSFAVSSIGDLSLGNGAFVVDHNGNLHIGEAIPVDETTVTYPFIITSQGQVKASNIVISGEASSIAGVLIENVRLNKAIIYSDGLYIATSASDPSPYDVKMDSVTDTNSKYTFDTLDVVTNVTVSENWLGYIKSVDLTK
jgi:hypothetical protein